MSDEIKDDLLVFATIFDNFGQIIQIKESNQFNQIGLSIEGEQMKSGVIHAFLGLEQLAELQTAIHRIADYFEDQSLYAEYFKEEVIGKLENIMTPSKTQDVKRMDDKWTFFGMASLLLIELLTILFFIFLQ